MTGKRLDDEALRALLRRGDPAADGGDPAPEEIEAWRAAMLREAARASGHRRLAWPSMVQALAAVAAGAVALALLWTAWGTVSRRDDPPAGTAANEAPGSMTDEAPRSIAGDAITVPAPVTGPSLPRQDEVQPEARIAQTDRPDRSLPAAPLPSGTGQPAADEVTTIARSTSPVPTTMEPESGVEPSATPAAPQRAVEIPAVVPAASRRTLQFTTPGGTRVIWTLERTSTAGM